MALHGVEQPNLSASKITPLVKHGVGDMSRVRILHITKDWQQPQEFANATALLCAALATGDVEVQVFGRQGCLEYHLDHTSDASILEATLWGAFPGIKFAKANKLVIPTGWRNVAFAGVPNTLNNQLELEPRLDHFYQSLAHRDNWCLTVTARPIDKSVIEAELKAKTGHLSTLLGEQQQGGRGQGDVNARLARTQREVQRFEEALTLGLWLVTVNLSTDQAVLLQLGAAQLQAALAGRTPLQSPFRAHAASNTATYLTSDELSALIQPPSGSHSGFEVIPGARFAVQPSNYLAQSNNQQIKLLNLGILLDRHILTRHQLQIEVNHLTMHSFITGQTGFGKSNTVCSILEQLQRYHKPFLVIEPAKREYQRLKGVRVFSAGGDPSCALRLNPFAIPDGARVSTHIDRLVSLFIAAFGLFTPIDLYLKRAMEVSYEMCGWKLAANSYSPISKMPKFPDINLIIPACQEIIASSDYTSGLGRDLSAALVGRLESLTNGAKKLLFGQQKATPDDDIFESSCVVELEPLGDDADKAFTMGLLLLRLRERYEALPNSKRDSHDLRHLTVIEEAHRLLANVGSDIKNEVADSRSKAVEVFTQLIAEVRSYGEGIIISEQIPSKISVDVIKNSAIKIVHRLPALDDRTLIGGTMALDDDQVLALAKLDIGHAVVFAPDINATLVKMNLQK
jgi:hypothetical protein